METESDADQQISGNVFTTSINESFESDRNSSDCVVMKDVREKKENCSEIDMGRYDKHNTADEEVSISTDGSMNREDNLGEDQNVDHLPTTDSSPQLMEEVSKTCLRFQAGRDSNNSSGEDDMDDRCTTSQKSAADSVFQEIFHPSTSEFSVSTDTTSSILATTTTISSLSCTENAVSPKLSSTSSSSLSPTCLIVQSHNISLAKSSPADLYKNSPLQAQRNDAETDHLEVIQRLDSSKEDVLPTIMPEVRQPHRASYGRSLPIHCVIEQGLGENHNKRVDCRSSHVVLDSYAILPGSTLLSELVTASLLKLGYPTAYTHGAKGGVQLKNWKTLTFDAITDNVEATVEEILGEVTSMATLRIRLCSDFSNRYSEDVKTKILELLMTKSKDLLIDAGCPLDKSLLEAFSKGEIGGTLSDQVCSTFNDWYAQQKEQNSPDTAYKGDKIKIPSLVSGRCSMKSSNSTDKSILKSSEAIEGAGSLFPFSPVSKELADIPVADKIQDRSLASMINASMYHKPNGSMNEGSVTHRISLDKGRTVPSDRSGKLPRLPSDGNIPSTLQNHHHHHGNNPYLGLMPGKTRIRTSFDPEHEIPRLQKWFSDNQHPSREQMMRFMQELNALESRRGRRPLDLTNIIYWFKNARAAQRRANKAMDDSFENEENIDLNVPNSQSSGNSCSDAVPPYLPNKNAVYMIPFPPYPHLVSGSTSTCEGVRATSVQPDNVVDEPYDLSVTKRSTSASQVQNLLDETGKELDDHLRAQSTSPHSLPNEPNFPELENGADVSVTQKKRPLQCPPRFPALLDVAAKMRQEIPVRVDEASPRFFSKNDAMAMSLDKISPYKQNGSENTFREADENSQSPITTPNFQNGITHSKLLSDQYKAALLSLKCESTSRPCSVNADVNSIASMKNGSRHSSSTERDTSLELGQVKHEEIFNRKSCGGNSSGDEEDTNGSFDSEEELKLRMKQSAAAVVADYASAMHSNVSRLTAANMAALSLAQMGQSLHIPQLPPSLAMAYYPMDPRFYSQPTVPLSSSSSPPSSVQLSHSAHLSTLSVPRSGPQTPTSHMDGSSPLPSPSSIPNQSINHPQHHSHHSHHHQQHQNQHQQSQQPRHHNSEPRKRRTRVFIDPLTEIPKLEKWFMEDTHPSAFMIDKFCAELNKCEYRHKFPKLEPKNVQLWFKNHRAKVKRMKVSHSGGSGDGDVMTGPDDDLDDSMISQDML